MAEEKKEENIYLLFAPKSIRGLRVDYPELSDYEEFKNLRPPELLFVWYFACKSSPFFNAWNPKKEVTEMCLKMSKLRFDQADMKAKFLSGNFGDRIQTAIPIMQSFEPSARIIAKRLAFKHLQDIKKMTSLTLDEKGNHEEFENAGGEISFTKKKAYMDMVLTASKELPGLIAKAEKGFSVTRKEKKVGDKSRTSTGDTFAEDYHNNN